MRPIDADALFAEFENVGWYNNADRDEIAERLVLQAPTIDAVSVVRGEWIEVDDYFIRCKCSICDWESHKYEDDVYGMPYCPNCGAKMKGVNDETEIS